MYVYVCVYIYIYIYIDEACRRRDLLQRGAWRMRERLGGAACAGPAAGDIVIVIRIL